MKKCEKCGIEYEGNYCPSGCNSPAFANAQQPGAQQPVQYQASGQPAPQNPYQQPVYQQPTQPVYQQPIQQGQYYPQQQMPTIIINNANTNTNTNMNTNAHPMYGRPKNKHNATQAINPAPPSMNFCLIAACIEVLSISSSSIETVVCSV